MRAETKRAIMSKPAMTAEQVLNAVTTKDLGRFRVSVTVNVGEP